MHNSTQCIHYVQRSSIVLFWSVRPYCCFSTTEYFVLEFAVLEYMHSEYPCSVRTTTIVHSVSIRYNFLPLYCYGVHLCKSTCILCCFSIIEYIVLVHCFGVHAQCMPVQC